MTPLASADAARQFILAGNAIVTFESCKTGAHLTFRVEAAEQPGAFFVKLLTGPENTRDYTYLGMIVGERFRLTKASKHKSDSRPVKAFAYVLDHIVAGEMPPHAKVHHEGRCGRCGRTLTVPESIERGIGPECWGKLGGGE